MAYCDATFSLCIKSFPSVPTGLAPPREAIIENLSDK